MQYFRGVVGDGSSFCRSALGVVWMFASVSCARTEMPDPRTAALEYRRAVSQGDAVALRALLSEQARAAYTQEEVQTLLEQDRAELEELSVSVTDPGARVGGSAILVLVDQRRAELTLEDGQFRLSGTLAFPAFSDQPEQALQALSQALSSRSLELFLSLLTEDQRDRLGERMDALAESLLDWEHAVVRVRGDRAEVELPDGQKLLLRREQGAWKFEEIP